MKKQLQNEPEVVGLITKVLEQLAALDKKVDSLIDQSLPQAKPAHQPPAQASGRPSDHRQGRLMYQATCADCKKACEIPFKPRGDRPVYCQECFRRRKATNTLKVIPDSKPKVTPPSQTVITPTGSVQKPPAKEKKKPAAKKSAPKKKPVAKKKK
jgi:CxxC-x17-CxxC domain-containing protein